MSNVYFISDLHFGHKNILQFSGKFRGGSNIHEHDEWLLDSINSVVTARDVLYVLGDLSFTWDGLWQSRAIMCGNRKLVMGNHDTFPLSAYMDAGWQIMPPLRKYKGHWLSHAPIHPQELRGVPCIHGHVHFNTIPDDDRYVNVCVENVGGIPISFNQIREGWRG